MNCKNCERTDGSLGEKFTTRRDVERYASDQPISDEEQKTFIKWILKNQGDHLYGNWYSGCLPETELNEILEQEGIMWHEQLQMRNCARKG